MQIYQKELMDHFKNPKNCGHLENPDFKVADENPSCGDKVSIEGKIQDDLICDLKFVSSGCVLSQASASILTEMCKNKKISEVLNISPETFIKEVGITLGPNRIKCALLPLVVLKKGLAPFNNSNSR
ncbi:MAG: NifU family SUF system FeS assembly protein [candidate division TM6 bacterium GW2011_GWE2_31_21]|nr:MAG: NifU family SUF system FeS assembly protein [candidate division TM6 bacterium GW2011_GWE2_31_21]KKP53086.1 MAG: NifU family SUF system FeS assembly protein [candidate division TM6 bacterium GW2011_GWF2_33_332]